MADKKPIAPRRLGGMTIKGKKRKSGVGQKPKKQPLTDIFADKKGK